MHALASRLAAAPVILVLLLAPPAAHFALVMHRGTTLAGILVGAQAVLVGWIALSRICRPAQRAAICGVIFVSVLGVARFADGGPLAAAAVPHATAYLALLALFATSLQPGREPVITILARQSRGRLPAEIEQYTRHVTWAWSWFFLAQLAGSFMLMLFAPLTVWSLFVNLCNLPLVGVMLCTEYAYRQWRHAARPPERLADMARIIRQLWTAPASGER
jgi:uncharacterized membrane protein